MNNQNTNNASITTAEAANTSNCNCGYNYDDWQHVHELTGSTKTVTECQNCHNHRFCTVSGRAIRRGNSHVHEVKFYTDTADGHSHEFCDKTSAAISVGNGKHVHYINGTTETEDGHVHKFQAATLIENPTDFECEKRS